MLLSADLARAWPHDRAHYFSARARSQADDLGLAVPRLVVVVVVLLLVPPAGPLTVAVDDSLFRRSGRMVYGAGWQYDRVGGQLAQVHRVAFLEPFVPRLPVAAEQAVVHGAISLCPRTNSDPGMSWRADPQTCLASGSPRTIESTLKLCTRREAGEDHWRGFYTWTTTSRGVRLSRGDSAITT